MSGADLKAADAAFYTRGGGLVYSHELKGSSDIADVTSGSQRKGGGGAYGAADFWPHWPATKRRQS